MAPDRDPRRTPPRRRGRTVEIELGPNSRHGRHGVEEALASFRTRIEAGATVQTEITLVGRATTAVEAVLAAFDFAARSGLGRGLGHDRELGRARLTEARAIWRNDERNVLVYDEAGGFRPIATEVPTSPCPPQLRVTLATPLRLTREANDQEFERYVTHAKMSIRGPMRQERASKRTEARAPSSIPPSDSGGITTYGSRSGAFTCTASAIDATSSAKREDEGGSVAAGKPVIGR